MKELGYVEIYFSIDKTNWVRHCGFFREKIHYREPEEDEIVEFTYEKLDESGWNFWSHTPWIFNRKEYKEYSYFHGDEPFKVYPNETLYIKKSWNKLSYKESFDYLSSNMDADEFIEYIKDNGLNICPVYSVVK